MEVKTIDRAKVNLENGNGNVVFSPMLFQEEAEVLLEFIRSRA